MSAVTRPTHAAHLAATIVLAALLGCADPADRFIAQMDRTPPDQRVPDWETTRALMMRPAPAVGDRAPDFTLPTPDGEQEITRSQLQGARPMVLIFGSFT